MAGHAQTYENLFLCNFDTYRRLVKHIFDAEPNDSESQYLEWRSRDFALLTFQDGDNVEYPRAVLQEGEKLTCEELESLSVRQMEFLRIADSLQELGYGAFDKQFGGPIIRWSNSFADG